VSRPPENQVKAIVRLNLLLLVLGSLIVSTDVNASGELKLAAEYDSSNVPRTFGGDDALRPHAPTEIAPVSVQLSWVRGKVLSLSPVSITLQLRKGSLKLRLDAGTVIITGSSSQKVISANELEVEKHTDLPAVGSVVQAHYVSRHNERRAVIIVDDVLSGDELSRKPGTSYLGVLEFSDSYVGIRIRGRYKRFELDYRTRLSDRTDHLLATGGTLVAPRLHVGETLLVIYRTEAFGMEGFGYLDTALEIRRLAPSP
jgi:hypothetical protein